MAYKVAIIEDEADGQELIENLLERFGGGTFNVAAKLESVSSAIEFLSNQPVDIVFLDVQIAGGTSFEILQKLKSIHFEIVFITSYGSFALDAIKFSAIDYLLKPLQIDEFRDTLEKLKTKIGQKQQQQLTATLLYNLSHTDNRTRKITVSTSQGYEFLELNHIIWCGAEGTYTNFYLLNGSKITSSKNLGHYGELLEKTQFCRINHGIIINTEHIKRYIKGKGGTVVMCNELELEVSQRRKADFLEKLNLTQ